MNFRCYCCGEETGDEFALVSMSESTVDRVFIMKPEHVERVEEAHAVIVKET